jgi:hypothetical protein
MINKAFCELLEYKITAALQKSPDDSLKGYWCDGILLPTFENEYSQKYVNDNRRITLSAFIGIDGQDKYEVVLLLGKNALSKYSRGLNISDCMPEFETTGEFTFDSIRKQLIIELL